MQLIFALTTFLSAFLLFLVQPMIGKMILPLFGGVAAVWTTIMLFFTTVLLAGYAYVVWLVKKPKKTQILAHSIVLSLSALWFIYTITTGGLSLTGNDKNVFPPLSLLKILTISLGLPSFLLSTTSSLLQSWYGGIFKKNSPYWLYIVSNAGSLIGLFSYPLFFERAFNLSLQQKIWSWGILIYILLMVFVMKLFFQSFKKLTVNASQYKYELRTVLYWFFLPFVAATVMLAATNQISTVASPVPFVWSLTLGFYLLSFILAFIDARWYSKKFYSLILIILLVITFNVSVRTVKFDEIIILNLASIFFAGVVLHRALWHARPPLSGLTGYYLVISGAGVFASLFVSLLAPLIFKDITEYPLSFLLATAGAIAAINIRKHSSIFAIHATFLGITMSVIMVLIFLSVTKGTDPKQNIIYKQRNFYGALRVININKTQKERDLFNGSTSHGTQILENGKETEPTSYYSKTSGLAKAISARVSSNNTSDLSIGMVGLGAGTAAAYCNNGSYLKFYEINPAVITISREYFTFLSDAEKRGCVIDIVEGDARISMEAEVEQEEFVTFDVLAIDAFTDDIIPIHLLTVEAMETYLKLTNDSGIIAFHISNRYFNLVSVIQNLAWKNGLYLRELHDDQSHWILVSRKQFDQRSYVQEKPAEQIWTDDRSDLLEIIKR